MSQTIGVLFSGGIDSTVLAHHLLQQGHTVQPFYVRCGLVWERAELTAARQIVRNLAENGIRRLVELDHPLSDVYPESHWSITGRDVPGDVSADDEVFLPGRNLVLIVKAALWCQLHAIPTLAIAALGTSPFLDAKVDFSRDIETVLSQSGGRTIEVTLPLIGLDKRQVMRLGCEAPLEDTFSCLAPVGTDHCGRCNKCAERQRAFTAGQRTDRTRYATDETCGAAEVVGRSISG